MKVKIFAVYDSKVGAYMSPFFMQSAGAALRAWENACGDSNTEFYRHGGDFTLFEIGVS